uniref:Ribosomal protein S20 n=1 Tax=Gelidium vagum TaxID=35171 RepID=A0A141SDY1_GELVA|nr:ribosomal protein S20 [Gelidium vagum]AMK96499.1 ribosomal protein S20 [Gelidium vagum]
MSKNLSAIKKHKVSLRNAHTNKVYKSIIKTRIKKYLLNIQKNDSSKIQSLTLLSKVYQIIDKAVKKRVLHKNKAARKKSSLHKRIQVT